MKNEPYFFWCHSSEDTSPVLYAITNPSPHAVYYLDKNIQKEPVWYRSSCWTDTTLTMQFNNPQKTYMSRFSAVDPCELLFQGIDVPPVPSSEQPQPKPADEEIITPPPYKASPYTNTFTGFMWKNEPLTVSNNLATLASDIADAGRYQERRATISYLRNLADVLENSIPKK